MHPPSVDFYAGVAGLIPLLLVTAALDGRRLGGKADDDEPLSLAVLFFAVVGEIAALAGLAGNRAVLTTEAASLGAGLLASAIVGPIALRLLPPKGESSWRRWPYIVLGLVTVLAPLIVALGYTVRLMT